MRRLAAAAALLCLLPGASLAEERVEIITHVPSTTPGDFDRLHANRATIGSPYSKTIPAVLNNGTLLVGDRLGVGLGASGAFSASPPTRRLVVRGADNELAVAGFIRGADWMPPTNDSEMRVGIGTDNPVFELEVYQPADAVFMRLWGGSDTENFAGIDIRSTGGEANNITWQIAHKPANATRNVTANDLQIAQRNEDTATWIYPVALSATGRLGVGLDPVAADADPPLFRMRPASRLQVHEVNFPLPGGDRITTTTDNCGILVANRLATDAFVPGLFWAIHGLAVRSPIAGIYARQRNAIPPFAGELHFSVSNDHTLGPNVNAMMINQNGRIGIGTDLPADHVHVRSTNGLNNVQVRSMDTARSNYLNSIGLILDNNTGEDVYIDFSAHGGGAELGREFYGRIWYKNDGVAADPDGMGFFGGLASGFPPSGTPITGAHMFIDFDGDVGIGTTTPSHKLTVAGDINLTGQLRKNGTAYLHPDYVFEPGYPLLPFGELRGFLQRNRRLPGMPSLEQVRSEGVGLFEHGRLQLEKTEELYLYLLQFDRRLAAATEELELENRVLAAENLQLERRLIRLEALAGQKK